MLNFPTIKRLKLKFSIKSKRERFSSLMTPNNYKNQIKRYNNFPSMICITPTNFPIKYKTYRKNKNKHKISNSPTVFISKKGKIIFNKKLKEYGKIINYPTEKYQIEKDIKYNIIEFNNKSKDEKPFFTLRENYSNLSNIIHNKPKNINKFIEKINSFLLPNDKTYENIQNLINNEIATNRESSKINTFNQLLKNKKIPINTYNSGLIFRYIIKNTFINALKKALLNKVLIDKNDIKEEYQKQIDDIKLYLILKNKEENDVIKNQNFESSIINKNFTPLITYKNNNKLDSNKNNKKKMKLQKHRRNRNNIQTNSSDNVFSNREKYKKELLDIKTVYIGFKRKKSAKNSTLTSFPCNDKESREINIHGVILEKKMDNLKENELKNIIKKQKKIIESHIKIKEKIKKRKNTLIKVENYSPKDIKVFGFLSDNKSKNKNEDIIDYINNSEKSFRFENILIEDQNDKSIFKRTFFDKRFNIGLNLFPDYDNNNIQQNNEIINENNSQISNNDNEEMKGEESKNDKNNKILSNKKLYLKKMKTLNIQSFQDYLKEEKCIKKSKELNKEVQEKKNYRNKIKTVKKFDKEREEKLKEERWEFRFNNFKNNIKRLKNMSREEFIKDTLKFIKYSK